MGEYARYKGDEVKIGTCEDMYYLRADQRDLVDGPDADTMRESLGVVRFRFPFPDEDDIEPGHFPDAFRGVRVPGYVLPSELSGDEHHSIQFSAPMGYLVSLPCPEQFRKPDDSMFTEVLVEGGGTLRVGRNGFSGGGATVVQQAFRGGVLVTLLHCGSCGAVHRLDTIEDAEPVIAAFREEAERQEWRRLSSDWDEDAGRWEGSLNYGFEPVHGESAREEMLTIADRIEAGYSVKVPA